MQVSRIYRYFAYSLAFLVVCLLVLGLGFFWLLIKKPMPQVRGEIYFDGLSAPVKILRDDWGVPHIFAENEKDLFFASGFVQAQDRLFQMDLLRRVCEGRLAEIFGDIPEVIDQDKFARTIGFYRLAQARWDTLSQESKDVLSAFARGVNAFLERRGDNLPIEFKMLGYKPKPWTAIDSLAIGIYIGWGLSLNWEVELIRYQLAQERGLEKAFEIFPRDSETKPYIIQPGEFKLPKSESEQEKTNEKRQSRWQKFQWAKASIFGGKRAFEEREWLKAKIDAKKAYDFLRTARMFKKWVFGDEGAIFASNSWVVAGMRTESGKPILCNDPHLELTLPSVWYEIHLKSPEYEAIGALFPGVPIVVLGHTRKIAWSATTTCADMDDLFILKLNPQNPNQYLYKGKWVDFELVKEPIKVKTGSGFKTIDYKVRISRFGPVVSDAKKIVLGDDKAIALCWTGFEPRDLIRSLLDVARSQNWEEFRTSIFEMGTPIQNWSYADINGNIGYISAGLYPIRTGKGWLGDFPAPAESGEFNWIGYLNIDQVPQVHNPSRGYIITANNEVLPRDEFPWIITFKFCPPYRAERIKDLLLAKNKLSIKDMMKIQYDYYSKQAELLCPILIKAVEKYAPKDRQIELALRHLKNWNYYLDPKSPAPTIFFWTYWRAFQLTYQDEMSPEIYKQFASNQFAFNGFDRIWIKDSELFDIRTSAEKENRDTILLLALRRAIKDLSERFGVRMSQWQWGRVHTLKLTHPLGSAPPLARWFDVFKINQGPFPVVGGWNTVNNSFYSYEHDVFKCFLGPSLRHIVDFGKLDEAKFVITGGESGQPWNKHYSDQTPLWLAGEYHPMWMNEKDIKAHLDGELILKPKKP